MKFSRLIIVLGCVLSLSFVASAQEQEVEKEVKKVVKKELMLPSSGNFMLEIDFDPFSDNGVFSFENLQTKYWLNDRMALRLGLRFRTHKNSLGEDDYEDPTGTEATADEKYTVLGFKPGIEFRILEGTKISPYIAFELSYRNKSSKANYDYYITNDFLDDNPIPVAVETDGAWLKDDTDVFYGSYSFTERGYTAMGANILFGADYFVMPHLYMGFEIGLGYEVTKYSKIKVNTTVGSSYIEPEEANFPSYKLTEVGFNYNSAIRLGVYF